MNETSHIVVKFMVTLPSKFLIKHSTYLHNRLLDCSDSIKPFGKNGFNHWWLVESYLTGLQSALRRQFCECVGCEVK